MFFYLILLFYVPTFNDARADWRARKHRLTVKHDNDNRTLVVTRWSPIQGNIQSISNGLKIRSFLGIPYAKPPVGRLRFRQPEPLRADHPHSGIFQATHYSAQCLQPEIYADDYLPISEDCLYLNIYTPLDASPDRQYPVMFYVHGSGFALGSAARVTERADILAGLANIVVVSPNHRLGILGKKRHRKPSPSWRVAALGETRASRFDQAKSRCECQITVKFASFTIEFDNHTPEISWAFFLTNVLFRMSSELAIKCSPSRLRFTKQWATPEGRVSYSEAIWSRETSLELPLFIMHHLGSRLDIWQSMRSGLCLTTNAIPIIWQEALSVQVRACQAIKWVATCWELWNGRKKTLHHLGVTLTK